MIIESSINKEMKRLILGISQHIQSSNVLGYGEAETHHHGPRKSMAVAVRVETQTSAGP